MKTIELKNSKKEKTSVFQLRASVYLTFFFALISLYSFAQVTSSIDVDSIKIGEQITFKVEVDSDTSDVVIFPEGQTFGALEMIESYPIDTTKKDSRFNLIKKYGLTRFDSGAYIIPKQKLLINAKEFYTDSLRVEVREIAVDTTKQGLYDIKPIIEVEKSIGNWWKYLLGILLGTALAAFLLWWFIWRQKKLTEEEEIALLPPYDRAKLALQKLDESNYLQNENLKDYYSDLTFIIRKYLDEKVYDRSLESTTDELVSRLNLLKDGNQIELSKDDIVKIETILKRADLVKFAKGTPDIALAEIDRNTIDLEIDHVKEALPEPTEEEKLLDKEYKEEQERKKKRKKIVITIAISVFLLIATIAGFVIKFGYDYVKDTVIGHESKELLEGNWITSEYGFPPLTISTPKVLKREEVPIPEQLKDKMTVKAFSHGSLLGGFNIIIYNTVYNNGEKKMEIDLTKQLNGRIQAMESQGAKDIITRNEKIVTPKGAEGLKTFGTLSLPTLNSDKRIEGNYVILQFTSNNVLQQIIITSNDGDDYVDDIVERIIDSIELEPTNN